MMKESKMSLSQRVLGAVDLAIEFATLGEYGLEQVDIVHGRRERSGVRAGREALARPRRGCNEKEPPHGGSWCEKRTAATYSPRDASPKYHRR